MEIKQNKDMKTKIMNLFSMMESAESAKPIFATSATYASSIFVGKESNESTVRYALWARISLIKPLQNPYLTLTRFRLSLGSNLSRLCLASLICLCMLTVGVGNVWGTEGDEHEYTDVAFSQLLNNSATISDVTITDPGYPVKKIVANCRYNKTVGGVTISITIGGNSFGTNQTHNANSTVDLNFTDDAMTGDIVLSFTNNCGSGTGKGTFYLNSVTLVEGPAAAPAYTITATRNNDSYGTVSVTGTTITATPNSGYRVMSGTDGYTVTSGTATVVNNGDNTFTVTPSSNCTVQINFESKGCTDHGASSITGGALSDADHGPVHAYYDYSTSQILYTKSDLDLAAGKKGTIKSIYFEYSGAAAMAARTIKIYMANTDLSSLTTSNYVPYASFTQVYSGTFSCGSAGWYEITLDTPFDYNGAGQLAVMIDDNTNTYESSKSFKYHSATGKQIYKRQDDTDIDPASWTPASAIDYRPNTKFCIQEADMTPATITLMDNSETRTEVSAGAGVTLPSREGCAGYTFAGWTKTWVAPQSSWTTTAPTIIPAGSYTPTANENLYPVYTKEEGGGEPVETKTQEFQYDTWEHGGSSTDKSSYRLFHNGGYVESASNVDFSKLSKVIVYGGTFGGDSYNGISIKKADGTVWKNATVSGSSQTGENTITGGTSLTGSAKLRVYSTSGSSSSTGVRISKVEVYTMEGGTTTYYISEANCCSLQAATSVTVTDVAATSVTLGWTAPSPTTGITKLQVVDGNGTVKVDNLAASAISATVTGLEECESYTFHVVSVGASCNVSSASVPAQPFSGAKTVTYNYHEGTGSPASFTTDCSHTSTALPTPTRANYRFDGWYTSASGGTRKGGGGDSYTPDATIELHAQWTRVYTVSYNYNGGSGSCVAGGPYAESETVTTCASATKEGATLTGWRRSDNDATVTPGNTFAMPASNVTLTAVWADTEYTLTQTVGSHTTKGHTGTVITSGMTSPSGLDLTYSISDNSYALPKIVNISGGGQTWTLGTNYTWDLSADKHSATLHLGSNLTISENVTVTIAEQTRYTVVWDEHGSTTTEYYATDDNSVTMKGGISDCGEKKFYGWTEDAEFVSHEATPPTIASSGTISGNKHYYAIFADAEVPVNPGYTRITSGNDIESGIYMIASPSQSLAYAGQNSTNDYASVLKSISFADDAKTRIASLPSGAVNLTLTKISANKFTLKETTGATPTEKYLKGVNDNKISYIATSTSPSLDDNYYWQLADFTKDEVTTSGQINNVSQSGRFFRYNSTGSGRIAAYQTSATTSEVYLYKLETTSYSNFAKTCTLYDIEITTPSGGTVTTTPAAGTGAAGEGQTVTVNVTPNSCKYLSALKYNDGSDHAISIASTPYTFTMPAADVTVTATFEDKTVSSIAPSTASHRVLMEGTSFEGEQIRVTYNNGETEDLAWDNASLTFSGYNMSTLGEQTVSVAYSGSCGSANTSYSIEITDGIPVTFSDCGNTTVRKYDPGDVVPVETIDGEYPCVGWQFVGWSSSSVADNSTSFTPVTNFTASEARTLYAVYADTTDVWLSALDATEMRSGATYVIIGEYGGNEKNYALTTLDTLTNYLRRHYLSTPCEQVREPGTYKDRFKMKVNVPPSLKWFIYKDGDYWKIKNKGNNKYLKITTTALSMTNTAEDEFTFGDNDNNESKVSIQSHNSSYYLCYYNSGKYWNAHTSGYSYFCTNMQSFTSNPPCAPRSVTFHGNGGTVTAYGGGSSGGTLVVTEATRDAGINLPTASIDAEDCEGNEWNFFGWIDHQVDVTRVPILTTDMLFDGYDEENPNPRYEIVTDNDEFWAVYANTGEPETKYGTISFTMSDFNQSYSSTENTTTKTVTSMGDYAFGYVNIGHASNTGIQFEENLGEFYNKTSLGKVNSISFTTFNSGDINMLKVYVGNEEKTTDHQLTAGEMQNVGSTWTYFPTENESYFYITNVGKGNHSFVRVSGISVDFGQGTTVYATTPVCSTISLSGDVYVTSRNGVGIMAVTPLSVEAHQLAANADVVITSNSSDVYFSTDRTPNFSKASKPTASVTVRANASGELEATPIYVHYKPNSTGTGAASDVTVYANLSPANPNIKGEHTIHVRNLPETVVIAAKVGTAWYALNGNMSTACNPKAVQIEVDESTWTAYAADTFAYKLWPVKTTNGGDDRYQTQGEKLRFSAVNHKTAANAGLWANDNSSTNTIKDNAVIDELSDGSDHTQYEWKITTTATGTTWKYTLQMDQGEDHNNNKLNLHRGTNLVWGTYSDGSAVTSDIYLLKFSEIKPFEFDVVEWYPTKMLIQTNNSVNTSAFTAYVDGTEVTSPAAACASKGSKLYEVTNLPLTTANATKSLKLKYTDTPNDYVGITNIPIIISQGTKNVGEAPFTTLTPEVYKDVNLVVRDDAVLTVNGTEAENTFTDVTIHPTAKISVPSSKTMKVNKLTFFGGIDEVYDGSSYTTHKYDVPELSLKGKLKKTVSAIDYVMRVDQSQMYSLAVPYDVTLNNIKYWDGTSMGTLGDNLWISAYDGAARASKDMENTWVYEVNFETKFGAAKLKQGVGYTISADMQSGVGNEYAIIRMPMTGHATNTTEAAKTVAVTAHGSGADVTPNHKGWNLVGNPYMASISGSTAGVADDSKIVVGYLNENAGTYEWVEDTYRYVTIPDNDGKGYTQTKWSDATLPPFKNFFIQVGTTGDLSFALGSRADAPARNVQAQKREVEFEVLLAGDERQDHTGLLIGERYTPEYEINADLEKMENKLSVYTLTGGYKLAYNALSEEDAKQPIPVGYIADAAGTYTFMLDEIGSLETIDHVWLTDYDLNRVTDLMDFPYAFTTIKGRNETRFALSIELTERVDVVTDSGGSVIDEGNTPPMKFIYDDKLYILNHGILYDATGKRVNCINK